MRSKIRIFLQKQNEQFSLVDKKQYLCSVKINPDADNIHNS